MTKPDDLIDARTNLRLAVAEVVGIDRLDARIDAIVDAVEDMIDLKMEFIERRLQK